ncbi:unnamed protein product [marine sediment metagenome]|uniref:Uncharacterized protein n=1 Tax=marine sediment metagenome TaxID=412755 RepID=X1BNR4_9ZZZZ
MFMRRLKSILFPGLLSSGEAGNYILSNNTNSPDEPEDDYGGNVATMERSG